MRVRIGHTGLNQTLFVLGKSGTDRCECGKTETVEHVLMECERYTEKRMRLADKLQRLGSMESGWHTGNSRRGCITNTERMKQIF